jgi:hypothetical protein
MMRTLNCLAFAFVLVLCVGSPALARMASIQMAAPLQDHAEQSIQAAFKEAVETAVKGAAAMGMSWIQLGRAMVLEDMVAVQIIASDTKPEGEATAPEDQGTEPEGNGDQQSQPGAEPSAGAAQPARVNR